MIKSLYLRLFFLGIPGLYLAIELSRFSLSMVNAIPYYFAMILIACSIFCGMLSGFLLRNPFKDFLSKNYLQIWLTELLLLNIGHLFNWMDAGCNAVLETLYYFTGLYSIGFICSLNMQYNRHKERNILLLSFIFGSIISFFIGVKYFEQSYLDLYLGIPVCIILLLDQIFICPFRSWQRLCTVLLLALINITVILQIHFTSGSNFYKLTHLGYTYIQNDGKTLNIIDNQQRVIKDIPKTSMLNINELPIYQLQANRSKLDVLFIGYPGSWTPVSLVRSPFVKKLDLYLWDVFTPKGLIAPTVKANIFYKNQWDFFNKFKKHSFDLIIIESMPEESESSRRVFLYYAKKLLKQPNGIIAFPESIVRKYDGPYIKTSQNSPLVMLMGGESSDSISELENRQKKFMTELSFIPDTNLINTTLPDQLVTSFDTTNSAATHSGSQFKTILPPHIIKLLLYLILGIYLLFRLFKCRYKNNQNKFFSFEAGFTFSIIIFSTLMLLSELRLVYPCFTPALFGISLLVILPPKNKKFAAAAQFALLLLLFYLTSINIVRAIPPIYVMPFLIPLSFIAIADTLSKCKLKDRISINSRQYILFTSGVLLTLLLLLFAKNNNLYPALIYCAIASRFLYYFKI